MVYVHHVRLHSSIKEKPPHASLTDVKSTSLVVARLAINHMNFDTTLVSCLIVWFQATENALNAIRTILWGWKPTNVLTRTNSATNTTRTENAFNVHQSTSCLNSNTSVSLENPVAFMTIRTSARNVSHHSNQFSVRTSVTFLAVWSIIWTTANNANTPSNSPMINSVLLRTVLRTMMKSVLTALAGTCFKMDCVPLETRIVLSIISNQASVSNANKDTKLY